MCNARCAITPCGKVKGDPKAATACFIAPFGLGVILLTVCFHVIYWSTRWKSDIHQIQDPGSVGDLYQIVEDWNSVPFVDLQVVNGTECPAGTEPAYNRLWKGTEEGCWHPDWESCGQDSEGNENCVIWFGEGFVETQYDHEADVNFNDTNPNHFRKDFWGENFKRRYRNYWNHAECLTVFPTRPINMDSIEGTMICGTRGGVNFMNLQRRDIETEKCPEGTSPCSTATSPDNTACYP